MVKLSWEGEAAGNAGRYPKGWVGGVTEITGGCCGGHVAGRSG